MNAQYIKIEWNEEYGLYARFGYWTYINDPRLNKFL